MRQYGDNKTAPNRRLDPPAGASKALLRSANV